MAIPAYPGDIQSGPALRSDVNSRFSTLYNYLQLLQSPSGTTEPGSPSAGQLFFNTTTGYLEVYTGSAWRKLSTLDVANLFSAKQTFQGGAVLQDGNGNTVLDSTTGTLTLNGLLTPNGGIAGALGTAGASDGNPINSNLLPNPTFDLGTAFWTWNPYFTVSWGGLRGSQALTNHSTGSGEWQFITSPYMPLVGGVTITVSGDMLCSGTTGRIYFSLKFYDSTKTQIGGETDVFCNASSNATWGRYSVTATSPSGTAYFTVACVVDANTTLTGSAAWKRIKAEIGSIATPFTKEAEFGLVQNPGILIPGLNAAQWGGLARGSVEFEIARLFSGTFWSSNTSSGAVYLLSGSGGAANPSGNTTLVVGSTSAVWYTPGVPIKTSLSNVSVYFEAQFFLSTSGPTAYAALWDMTANALVSGSTISSTGSTNLNPAVRSGPIQANLIAGHSYAPTLYQSGSTNVFCSYARLVGVV